MQYLDVQQKCGEGVQEEKTRAHQQRMEGDFEAFDGWLDQVETTEVDLAAL